MYCKTCGRKIDESASYCVNCGSCLTIENVSSVNKKRELNVVQLIWAIISIICLCFPLGIISLVFVIMAQDTKTDEEEKRNIKIAKTCNIAATIIAIIFYALCLLIFLMPFLLMLISLA